MKAGPSELEERKKQLKTAVEKLHAGVDVDDVRAEFKEILKDASPLEISKIEEELIEEGIPRERIQSLCDIHLELFKDSLQEPNADLPETHPIHILMTEHKIILNAAIKLAELIQVCTENYEDRPTPDIVRGIMESVEILKKAGNHYQREENVLFPRLEAHGIVQPPAIMWSEHDTIRGIEKTIFGAIESGLEFNEEALKQLRSSAISLSETLSSHFFKENNILFQTSLKLFSEEEWRTVRTDFDEIGYGVYQPKSTQRPDAVAEAGGGRNIEGMIQFESGVIEKDTLEALLNALPIDITFVNAEDRVQYFSLSPERIFVRSKSVIGREVRKCHPQKSVDKVEQILRDFKEGNRDKAEFWINLGDNLIYIRYFPVRNSEGKYLGCLEVTQDITEIQRIQGEKRLID